MDLPAVDKDPAFSPDGTQIAFERDGDIYKLTVGAGETAVTTGGAIDTDPNWSPDGTKIAFASNEGYALATDYDIYSVTGGGIGSQVTQVTDGTTVDERPAFSPDGTKIAFERGATSTQ